jgi:hypothetical protein
MTAQDDEALAPDLDSLAVEEQFLEEWRAGKRPQLSVYAVRYPQYAAALADLVMALPPDASADEAPEHARREKRPESFPERFVSGAGVRRALDAIFGETPTHEPLPRVAEQSAPYDAAPPQTPAPPDSPPDPSSEQ